MSIQISVLTDVPNAISEQVLLIALDPLET